LKPISIGICGLGTVGYGSFSVLTKNSAEISRRTGREIVVSHIATRSIKEHQKLGDVKVSADVFAVAEDPDVDIVLELIGG